MIAAAQHPANWTLSVVLAWFMAGLAQVFFAVGACVTPDLPWLVAEVAVFTLIGVVMARFVRPGWPSSLVTPGAVLIVSAVWRSGALVKWAVVPSYFVIPVLVVVAMRVFHDLTHRLPAPLVACTLSLLGAGSARLVTLVGGKTAVPVQQFAEDVARPLEALQSTPTTPKTPPIIVISVDTLRADHATTMETWKWFEARGATWTAAQATASWTVPALGSVWTGLLPAAHGAGDLPVGFASLKPVDQGVITLAEQAEEAGWDTAAFVANPFVSTTLGFRRGFRHWVNPDESVAQPLALLGERWSLPGRDGDVVVQHAIDYLDRAPESGFLLWVHLFDPHLPYTHLEEGHGALVVEHPKQIRRKKIRTTKRLIADVKDAYKTEVAYSDKVLMKLLREIERRGLDEDAIFVFFSDHGEELWEHDGFEHGHSHHKEVTEVPLALVAPCVRPGARAGVVSLQDIAPTLRNLAGFDPAPAEPQGYDLCFPVPEDRVVLAAGNLYGPSQASGRTITDKIIETRKKDGSVKRREQFDLTTDPDEQQPADVDSENALAETISRVETAADGQNVAPVSIDQLCALGYVDCDETE